MTSQEVEASSADGGDPSGRPAWLKDVEALRAEFKRRQEAGRYAGSEATGITALGDKAREAWREGPTSVREYGEPISAKTFDRFLKGEGFPNNISGMVPYFYVLGTHDEVVLAAIHVLLRREREAKIDALTGEKLAEELPGRNQAFRRLERIYETYLTGLAEVLDDTVLLGSPDQYLRWLRDDLQDLVELYTGLLRGFQAASPPGKVDDAAKKVQAAEQLVEFLTRSRIWLHEHPRFAHHLMSNKPNIPGVLNRDLVNTCQKLSDRVNEVTYEVLIHFARIYFKDLFARSETPALQAAVEDICEEMLAIPLRFHVVVEQGSMGMGGGFYGAYRLRRDMSSRWTPTHESLRDSYFETLDQLEELCAARPEVSWDEVAMHFKRRQKLVEPLYDVIWRRDYVPRILPEAGWGLASAFRRYNVWSEQDFVRWAAGFTPMLVPDDSKA